MRHLRSGNGNNDQRRFFCTQCSRCCRFDEGYVFLSKSDLKSLAHTLQESEDEVVRSYCKWVPMGGMEQLSLREQPNKDCIFWRDGGCSVYPGRPLQCRAYPFWRHIVDEDGGWEREAASCPGIGVGPYWSGKEIRKNLDDREKNTPIMRKIPSAGKKK